MTVAASAGEQFRRTDRLTGARDFATVFQNRHSSSGKSLLLFGKPNGLSHNRLGLSVGRRFGAAHQRARFKRLVREVFRRSRDEQPAGWDLVVCPARGSTARADPSTNFALIRAEFLELLAALARRQAKKKQSKERIP